MSMLWGPTSHCSVWAVGIGPVYRPPVPAGASEAVRVTPERSGNLKVKVVHDPDVLMLTVGVLLRTALLPLLVRPRPAGETVAAPGMHRMLAMVCVVAVATGLHDEVEPHSDSP